MTQEQLERGIALKAQIDELLDFANRISKSGFDISTWVPDNLKEQHQQAVNVCTLEYIQTLHSQANHLLKEFEQL